MNFNKAVIVGNLTRDPETRSLPSGQNVASFSIATNRIWTDQGGNKQEATEYHNIVAFGRLADICSQYLNRGRLVLIEGRIQTRSWNDKDGNKRYRAEIVAESMQMGPRPNASANAPKNQVKEEITQEEIPVIDAEESIDKPIENTEESEQGVNVKDIPF